MISACMSASRLMIGIEMNSLDSVKHAFPSCVLFEAASRIKLVLSAHHKQPFLVSILGTFEAGEKAGNSRK